MSLIEVEGLTKSFKTYRKAPGFWGAVRGLVHRDMEETVAVKDVSFRVEEGELVGFLGPNGAGKTTTLKMLSGLLYPTRGNAHVLGYVPWERHDGYRRQFALLLGQKNQLWWDLPARESLELNGKIYGLSRTELTRRVDELTEMLDARDKLNISVRELSLGERMKMELTASLLHEPRVLFLDEPTIGLDVVSQKNVREFLRNYNAQRKTTILLTSHYMADIQELCRRVIIIDHGAIFFDGPLAEIVDRMSDYKIVTIMCEPAKTAEASKAMETDLSAYGEVLQKDVSEIKLKIKRERVITVCQEILGQFPVKDIDIQDVPLEEVFRRLFAREHAPPTSPVSAPATNR